MVVVELAAADKLSAYYSTLFMDKLKNRLRAGNECMKLGFVFCWKKAESVINLKCNYKSCYAKGWSTARAIVQKSVRLRVAFDKEEFFKGMRMAAKELLPGGKDSTNQREKVTFEYFYGFRMGIQLLVCKTAPIQAVCNFLFTRRNCRDQFIFN